jgi:multisubunit Na+/H+ antiporter MnhB subunit
VTALLLLDLLLGTLLLLVALWVVAARRAFDAVAGFVGFGLLLALAWVRLGSVDVALTEAGIGAGIGGVLLLQAARRLEDGAAAEAAPGPATRLALAGLCLALTLALGGALLALPSPAPSLAAAALAPLPGLGLGNPVTGVLLAYRALDTLLEAVVLVLAVVGVWSLAPPGSRGGPPGLKQPRLTEGPLLLLARLLPPIGLLVGIHVVWTGAMAPGGAFQGGAILAAMLVLAWMAGLWQPPATQSRALRWGLVAGPALFLALGLAGFAWPGGVLSWPAGLEKPLILAVEAGLTLSIALGLALLVIGPPR